MADPILLRLDRLKLRHPRHDLVQNVIRRSGLRAICPCHVVAEFLVPQTEALEILFEMEEFEVVPLRELFAETSRWLPIPDRAQRLREAAAGAVAFVHRDTHAQGLEAIVREPRVADYFSFVELMRRLFPGYEIGPRLREQRGAEAARQQLDWCFRTLGALGSIGGGLLRSDLAHSSVVMLTREALGLPSYEPLLPILRAPVHALAMALTQTLHRDPHVAADREEFEATVERLRGAIERVVGPGPEERYSEAALVSYRLRPAKAVMLQHAVRYGLRRPGVLEPTRASSPWWRRPLKSARALADLRAVSKRLQVTALAIGNRLLALPALAQTLVFAGPLVALLLLGFSSTNAAADAVAQALTPDEVVKQSLSELRLQVVENTINISWILVFAAAYIPASATAAFSFLKGQQRLEASLARIEGKLEGAAAANRPS